MAESETRLVCNLPVQLAETETGVVVRRGSTQLLIRGQGIRIVLDLIFSLAASGGVSRAELDAFIGARMPSLAGAALDGLLDGLVAQGFLTETADADALPPAEIGPVAVLRWELGLGTAGRQLGDMRIVVVGANALAAHIGRALAQNGIGDVQTLGDPALADGSVDAPTADEEAALFCDSPGTPDLIVAATPLGNQTALRRWNAFAVERDIPFLPVVLTENAGQIGPFVIPHDGPCLECLRARQNAAAEDPELLRAVENDAEQAPHVRGTLASSIALVGELATIEIVKHLLSPRTFETVGHLLHFDMVGPRIDRRKILKVPRCRVCSRTASTSAVRLSRSIPVPKEQVE